MMADVLASILSRYTNFAMTGDGLPEISSLSYLPFEAAYPDPQPSQRLVLVLIEPRLIDASIGDRDILSELEHSLRRYKGDLRAEGLLSRFILAKLYRGPVHKDGRIVLALRQVFREVKENFPNFEGVVLIGNFPEATLVRFVSWAPGFLRPRKLVIGSEIISQRAEIVLADLTGSWEQLYRQDSFTTDKIQAEPDADTRDRGWYNDEAVRDVEFTSTKFTYEEEKPFIDAFFLSDSRHTILEHQPSRPLLRVRLRTVENNREVDGDDRAQTNVLARPDIAVSRINGYRVSVNPSPSTIGDDNAGFLDAQGNPQPVRSARELFSESNQHVELFTFHDFDFERRLMVSYFSRNHRFRNGGFSHLPFRGAIISGTQDFDPDDYKSLVEAAASDFAPCVKKPLASLQDYVSFLKVPAALKYIFAHSNSRFSQFDPAYSLDAAVDAAVGGPPLRWKYRNGTYEPTFDGYGSSADMFLHRAIWHHNTLEDSGASIIVHSGCNVNSVDETQSDTYTSERYAHWNNAEGLMWFTNAVALFSRAKGFNDAPWGFPDGFRLSDRANVGSCWKTYFNSQANNAGLATSNIQRKRAYFWSINGDWTLRLRNQNGLGLLTFDTALRSLDVHPNRAWIDGWNFDGAANRIRGLGDVDADGIEEIVVTSDWGVGLLKFDGWHFRCLLAAPRNTDFGAWRYDATTNQERDVILGVATFTGSPKAEMLVRGGGGMATLEFDGSTLRPTWTRAKGTRIGGWVLHQDLYWGSGQFDTGTSRDIVLSSRWGLGVISLQRDTSLAMVPNGMIVGDWQLDTTEQVGRIADFDGDGRDELFVTGSDGVAVFSISDGNLVPLAVHRQGSTIGQYTVDGRSIFFHLDDFLGSGSSQILASGTSGLHLLQLSAGRLEERAVARNGSNIDGWRLDTTRQVVIRAGVMTSDRGAKFIVRSDWGIGLFDIATGNSFRCRAAYRFGSVLGDWILDHRDSFAGFGKVGGRMDRGELILQKVGGPNFQ